MTSEAKIESLLALYTIEADLLWHLHPGDYDMVHPSITEEEAISKKEKAYGASFKDTKCRVEYIKKLLENYGHVFPPVTIVEQAGLAVINQYAIDRIKVE